MNKHNIFFSLFFFFYFIFGLILFSNYGIGIEEHFQRQNGFYWLYKISIFFEFDEIAQNALIKFNAIRDFDPTLPNPEFFNFYGIFFDLPFAVIELIFYNLDISLFFKIRHLFNFLIFFISSIFFYQIIKKRFKNEITIHLGIIFYCLTPRIFGDSFYNNKDILFLSFLTISIYFLFEVFKKYSLYKLIFFTLFASIATSTRIMGLYLPLLFFIFLSIEFLANKISFKYLIKLFFLTSLFYLLFFYMHYPYAWKLNIFNFFEWISVFFYNMNLRIYFNGDYYHIKYLPRSYLPTWISITTPIYILLFFIFGYLILCKRFFLRLLNIKKFVTTYNDFWRSNNEKKDLFIFISFSSFFFYAFFFNVAMLSGWRHLYFLHIFLIYISCIFLDIFFIKKKIKLSFLTIFIFYFFLIYENYKFHPYQSLYFNNLFLSNKIDNFPIDTPSLSRVDGLRDIIMFEKNKKKISIANASWTPLYNAKDLLSKNERDKLIFVGQNYKIADYIFTNFIYEVNPKFNTKYDIPDNFILIKDYKIRNLIIYSIYKKNT